MRPGTVYFALFTVTPTDAGGGTEVVGGNYARVPMANNLVTFTSSVGGSKSNAVVIQFNTPSAGWGAVTSFGIFDALSGGNLLRWGPLTIPKTIDPGDLVNFAPGQLVCTED